MTARKMLRKAREIEKAERRKIRLEALERKQRIIITYANPET